MKKPELLAPAGNFDSLRAAIAAGCDAVYLSGYMFGARQFADNFSQEEIISAINLCHLYGVKIYITVNTLIYDEEVQTFLQYIDFLHKNNVDAVLIQDIGMLDLVKQTYPNLEVHASTQMHIHNINGVNICDKLGISRVVLARETTLNNIKEIRKNTNLELEIFVHGALCISYSGQCLMSSLIGGRSGNRGACAGSCRLPYKIVDSNNKIYSNGDYPISTKDLCTLEYLGELIDIGVDSLKIEGRMKRPEYVYLVVSLYRKAIDSYIKNHLISITEDEITEMKKVFNRGFTKGFLFNENNSNFVQTYRPNHLGIEIGKVINYKNKFVTVKLINELNLGDGVRIIEAESGCTITLMYKDYKRVDHAKKGDVVSFKIDGFIRKNATLVKTTDQKQLEKIQNSIKNNVRKILIFGKIIVKKGFPLKLVINDSKNEIIVEKAIVNKAINYPLTKEDIINQIDRLGNTIYKFSELQIIMEDDVYVNKKELNNIRREACNLLDNRRLCSTNYMKRNYVRNPNNYPSIKTKSCLINSKQTYKKINLNNYKYIYTEDIDLYEEIKNNSKVILKLPRVCENSIPVTIPVMVSELGGLENSNVIVSDFSLNVVNSYSVALLHSLGVNLITLSYELTKEQIKRIINDYVERYKVHPNLEIIAYSKVEAMVSKFNINNYYNTNNKLFLVDKFNNKYDIEQRNNLTYIIDYKNHYLEDYKEYYKFGINSVRFEFTHNEIKEDI